MRRGRRAPKAAAATLLCFFLFLYSLAISSSSTTSFDTRSSRTDKYSQEWARNKYVDGKRRRLVGPGSYPPQCRGKCSTCIPCRLVHVAVPPGTAVVAEYYPEAWRCKCRNRLYIP